MSDTNTTISAEKMENILTKVKGLLAMAGNNPSQEEAEKAALKAQELLAKYNLQLTDLGEEIEFIAYEEKVHTGVDKSFKYNLGDVIARNFRCKCYWQNRRYAVFYGHETDAKVAGEVFQYLFKICNRGANRAGDKAEREYGTRRGVFFSYTRGFVEGVREALDKQCQALMIVVPQEVNEGFEELCASKNMKDIGSMRDGSEYGLRGSAYRQGKSDGASAMREKSTKQIED